MQQNSIADNYRSILSGLPEDVLLVAVSKTRTEEEIGEAVAAGCRDFGENKAQELCRKYDSYPDVRWHFIGHLQKNKIRSLVGKACLIHSVDSMELALEINKRAFGLGLVQDILIQVNAAGETQKSGISPGEAKKLYFDICRSCPNVNVVGLMQIAPEADDPEDVRIYFKEVADLFKELGLKVLSMGMSSDYKVAVEEGANCVRIGSAIFGKRDYSKII